MPVLDHLIVSVNDREASLRFYTEVLGFEDEGERGPFNQVRLNPDYSRADFDSAFERIRKAGLEYGDSFDRADNMKGPGIADGAHGETQSLYLFDPNHHLIELLYYA